MKTSLGDYVNDIMLHGCLGNDDILLSEDLALLTLVLAYMVPLRYNVEINTTHRVVDLKSVWRTEFKFSCQDAATVAFIVIRKATYNDLPVKGYSGTGHDPSTLIDKMWELDVGTPDGFNTSDFADIIDQLLR